MNGIVPIPAQRALEIDERLREIDRAARSSFVEMGMLILEAEQKELWKYLADPVTGEGYRSWDQWISCALPVCRSSAYKARTLLRELKGLPTNELIVVPRSNLPLLAQLPQRKQLEWLEAAKLPRRKFIAALREGEPEYHFERDMKMSFNLTESQYEIIEGALELSMARNETESRELALESICAEYLLEEKNERRRN